MTATMIQHEPQHLRALVDMGSNGIRFSISSVQPPTGRILPTLYQHRADISLYDAQYDKSGERVPISEGVITKVLAVLRHFKMTCIDFGVPDANITVLATEATRTALNSELFRQKIFESIGWHVTMLSKEEEGRVGGMGVASSTSNIKGLVMDLGGGSTQLSWLIRNPDSKGFQMPESGAASMPYGAAALSRRLAVATAAGTVAELRKEIRLAIRAAITKLNIPQELAREAREKNGLPLYLSGGGFRGWGYILMSQHRVHPYPIPAINGFRVGRDDFLDTDAVSEAAAATLDDDQAEDIFRVSERRATQVPAVAFLVQQLTEALPAIRYIVFCQGGVREGFLFASLPPEIQVMDPLCVATQPYRRGSPAAFLDFLRSAFPDMPASSEILTAFANFAYYHAGYPKDLQTGAALRSTTSGVLANVHGTSHYARALLALLLCARWSGPLVPTDLAFKEQLQALVLSETTPLALWWANYLGAVAALIACFYPAGIDPAAVAAETRRNGRPRLQLKARWGVDKKQHKALLLDVMPSHMVKDEVVLEAAKRIEKVGKPKRWIGGKDGSGNRVLVAVVVTETPTSEGHDLPDI